MPQNKAPFVVYLRNHGVAFPAIDRGLELRRGDAKRIFGREKRKQEMENADSLARLGLSWKAVKAIRDSLWKEIVRTDRLELADIKPEQMPHLEDVPGIEGIELPTVHMLRRFIGRHPDNWRGLVAENCGGQTLTEIESFVEAMRGNS